MQTAKTTNWKYQWPVLVPEVQEKSYDAETPVSLDEGMILSVACADGASGAAWAAAKISAWYGVKMTAKDVAFAGKTFPNDEGYQLSAKPGELVIEAASIKGVKFALSTLRQIAQPKRGTMTVSGWEVPVFTVRDWPELAFRGLHLCFFPELSIVTIERQIRMAAYYKFNYVVLEQWGEFRSEKYPWYGFRTGKLTIAECHRLTAVAKDLGITLVPQLNVWGHATAARIGCGKNAILYHAPEYAPLFEPRGGWNWCLTNPETRKVLEGLIEELYEAFDCPPYFHLGGDEADGPSCATCCASPYAKILAEHFAAMAAKVESLGAKPMMWHDMLLMRGDERWKGFYANGNDDTVALLKSMPKDLVICDWHYGPAKEDGKYPTLDYFKELGFNTLTCPWDETTGIAKQDTYAREHGLNGVLGTVWHHFKGSSLTNIFLFNAIYGWSAASAKAWDIPHWTPLYAMLGQHWREIGLDTPGGTAYEEQGFYYDQVSASTGNY